MNRKFNLVFSLITIICISFFNLMLTVPFINAAEIYNHNFETNDNSWSSDNGVWEIGIPTYGPGNAHSLSQCAGTVLNGNYPESSNSRLISRSIRLSEVVGDDEIHLRFWHWFSYYYRNTSDNGVVEISVYDDNENNWSNWEAIHGPINSQSLVWSEVDIDLTTYANKKIKIAFHHVAVHTSVSGGDSDKGWYIDDFKIINYASNNNIELTDSDNDGVVDQWDNCPNTPEGSFTDNKGCPIDDTDNDGVPNHFDLCQNTISNTYVDKDGCPLQDSDNDLVPNLWDDCNDSPLDSCVKNGCPCLKIYTQEEMDNMVKYILQWGDTNDDGFIGLSEAINALEISSGVKKSN